MAAAAMKHMASSFAKLKKFKGVDFRIWQKKMHFILFNMSVVYVLTTPMPKDGCENRTVEQVRKRVNSKVIPDPVLDEIIALSGETEIPKVMKVFFEQQIVEEEAFTKYIRDKIVDVKASLTRETKDRLELKLSRLIQLADENFDGVKELKVHYAIMDLCE
uniref:Zinc finger, CCHC-type n=1 Tax=Tanacetum cinerariifolium TaxID=118510 RepID=A0A699IMY5_TANCI|nr:zinc finger, CCHC-type [Tanacetum cinerariifolium]